MPKGIDMLNIFYLDLKFKVTKPFEGQNVTFSSTWQNDRKLGVTSQSNLSKWALISVALIALFKKGKLPQKCKKTL